MLLTLHGEIELYAWEHFHFSFHSVDDAEIRVRTLHNRQPDIMAEAVKADQYTL